MTRRLATRRSIVLAFEGLVGAAVVQIFSAPSDRIVTIAEL